MILRAAAIAFALALAPAAPAQVVEDGEAASMRLYKGAAPFHYADIPAQQPDDPGLYDARASAACRTDVSPITLAWGEPAAGVNSETGILIVLPGIASAADCTPVFGYPDPNWVDDKNLVLATPFYRNLAFATPYDFGKMQVSDVLRGLGHLLEEYPQIDRRRIYLLGGSGGGHLALQTLQFTPQLWAEVHIHKAITRISTRTDVTDNGYDEDPYNGWNVNMGFPITQGGLSDAQWTRYRAERALRSPQNHIPAAAIYAEEPNEAIPPVYMGHGDADPTVDFQHFLDFIAAIESYAGHSTTPISTDFSKLGNYTFLKVIDGNHYYPTNGAVNYMAPNAFTRMKETEPDTSFTAYLPEQFGYTFLLDATDLRTATVHTVPALAVAEWEIYE